ncbi:tetratricopeptide repeat protein [Gimesia sp.]|uniref:tetratricopeptide repeat protein n=1 Tax=Gimesia sp. TaxID=2024833 RepID=UPI003A8D4C85
MYATDEELDKLTRCYEIQRWDEGLCLSQSLLKQFPHDGRVWELSGMLFRELTSFKLAQNALETATTLIPLSDRAQLALADCYLHFGQRQLAGEMFQFLYEKEGIAPQLHSELKDRLQKLTDSEHQGEDWDQAELQRPKLTAEHHYNLAHSMGYLGYPPECVEQEILRAIELAPDCLEYRIGLAGFLSQVHRAEEGYQYVAGLSLQEISRLECECCLERLVKVFHAGGDHRRLLACMDRVEEVKRAQRNRKCINNDEE